MKPIAIILVIVCLAAFTGIAYMYMNAVIEVTDVKTVIFEAGTQQALFDELKTQTDEKRLIGTMFADDMPQKSDDLVFLQYTVSLANNTFLNAEEAEIQITPVSGDILQIGETQPADIRAHEAGNVQAVLLTHGDTKNIRELTVTYYLWGIPFRYTTTSGR